MGKKVKELTANPMQAKASDPHCTTCNKDHSLLKQGKISHSRLWKWTRETKLNPFKGEETRA